MNFKHELSPSKPLLRSTLSLILGKLLCWKGNYVFKGGKNSRKEKHSRKYGKQCGVSSVFPLKL